MRKLLAMLFVTCVTMGMWAQGVKPLPSLHVEGKWLVDTHGNHVVLHGVMDTPSMWFNGNRWTGGYNSTGATNCKAYFKKLFVGLEKAKCNVFRLHLDPAWTNDNGYTYQTAVCQSDEWTGEANIKHFNPSRLTNFLKTLYVPLMIDAMKHGMYVVVRPPGVCPGQIKVGDYYQKYLLQVWDMVTQNDSVRKYAGQISIELANEPVSVKNSQGADDKKALHDFFQPIYDKIRANGFTGIVWIPGAGWQSGYADYKSYPITGYNIGYAVHDYDGWYGMEDKKWEASDVPARTQAKITQFHNQVPVVDTNPIIVTEIDWSPKKPGSGHYNEHGEWVESNYGTWATGRTSVWGQVTKNVHDYYGNISMTLSGTACLIDIDTLISKNKVVPAFGGLEEACGKACMDWYAEYYNVNYPKADFASVPVSDFGRQYKNPIVRADFPDPDVIRVGDTYYMVSTTMHHFPGATILKSQDLVNWEYCAQPLKQLLNNDNYNLKNDKNAYASGMWACSMKYHDGKFYILINGNNEKAWLLSATNPEGKWDVKRLGRNYYDPGMLFDNGKVYVVCGINHLVMCELDKNFNFKKQKEVVVRDDSGLEGCHLYKKGDYYYIYATYGGWPSGQVVFRSTDIFGPYEEKVVVEKFYNNVPNTIHQGALVEDVNGKWWTIMQEDLGALGRMPNLQPVTWKNDWPVVGNNGTPYKSFESKVLKPTATGNIRVKRLPTTDAFRTYPLGMQWEWNHLPCDTAWSLMERAGWLRIKTSNVTTKLPQARNMLTQRIFAEKNQYTNGTVRLDVSHLEEGDRAGICILQDPYGMICVEKKDGAFQLLWQKEKVRDAGSNFTSAEKTMAINLPDSIIYLRASIKFEENKAKFYYSLDNKTWKSFGSETPQSFNLSVFVGSRFGLFCYATQAKGGYADFDWFSTEKDFNEEDIYPEEFVAPTNDQFEVKSLVQSPATLETMVGEKAVPTLKATYTDRHTEYVNEYATFVPEESGIVEFYNGQMLGVGQGSTTVNVSYTDALGNTIDNTFTAKSGYFPFDTRYVRNDLVGTGTYKNNTTSAVFKFTKANSEMGWVYSANVDMSEYKYLVIELVSKSSAGANVNIYTTDNLKGACYSSPQFNKDSLNIVIDLDTCKYTSTTSKGKDLNRKTVRMVTFKGTVTDKLFSVRNMFLSNDEKYNTTGITTLTTDVVEQRKGVFDLQGRRMERPTKPGLYIMNGKKVIIK